MTTQDLTKEELRTHAFAVLLRELGPSEYVRFVRDILGPGPDESDEIRDQFNAMSVEEITARIQAHRHQNSGA